LELDLWDEKATGLMQEFDTLASISPIHRECLEKIYMRKVKLYDDNYYSSDEDEDDGDDSFYDSDDELDCCPKGCPVDIYTEILELREKRIHQDDERKLSQRQFENLKRTHDQNCSKLRQSEKHFEQLQTQIQIFEDKKHGVLNEISVDIPLVVNQVNVWEDGSSEIPGTQAPLTECVLFPHNDLAKLVKRSHDIAEEINQDRIGVKNLRKELTRRTKDKRSLEDSIILQKKRCEELQMLKFGQKVDIDTLDKLSETSSSVTSQSRNSKIHETAQEYEKQMNELETKNKELKNQLKNITNESTEILNQIVDFSKKQNTLMKAHQNISEKENESGEASKVNESEILHLRRMAINQVTEIERLEYDINKLKRKGGKYF
jgi:chromosome segregation ATPase